MKLRVLLSLLVAAVGLTVVEIAAPQTKATTKTLVTVTMGKPTEFHFILSKTTVAHGTVVFTLVNKGKIAHDFNISGKTSKKIGPGKTGSLTVTLTKGKKPYKCTVDAHAAAGMKGVLKVT